MKYLAYLRSKHGSVYATELPDGQVIPWRPLTVKEYEEYDSLYKSRQYPAVYIENEIFSKCVLDPVVVKQMNHLLAGTIPTVVAAIFAVSGPRSIEELNYMIAIGRMRMSGIIHQLVDIVSRAFPAYKPEDLYAMDYQTLIERVALAEKKLMDYGLLQQPIAFHTEQQKPQRTPTDTRNLKNMYQEERRPKTPPIELPVEPPPIPAPTGKQTIITNNDIEEHTLHYTGHEKEDRIILEHEMQKETSQIYDSYLEQVKKGDKLRIPTHEERVAIAKARAKENEAKFREWQKQEAQRKIIEAQELQKELAKAQADKRKKKKVRATRRR